MRSESGSSVGQLCAGVSGSGELHDQIWRLKLLDSERGTELSAVAATSGGLGERWQSSRETEKKCSRLAACQPTAQLVSSPRSDTQCLELLSTPTQSKPHETLTTTSLERPTTHPSLSTVTTISPYEPTVSHLLPPPTPPPGKPATVPGAETSLPLPSLPASSPECLLPSTSHCITKSVS